MSIRFQIEIGTANNVEEPHHEMWVADRLLAQLPEYMYDGKSARGPFVT